MTKQEKQEQAVKLATLRLLITKQEAKIGGDIAAVKLLSGTNKTLATIDIAKQTVTLAEMRHQLELAKTVEA